MERFHYSVSDIRRTWFQRAPGAPPIRRESTVWRHIRLILLSAGFDVVRQVPARDGNLTSAPFYIRERHGRWCLHDGDYQLRSLAEEYNVGKRIELTFLGEDPQISDLESEVPHAR